MNNEQRIRLGTISRELNELQAKLQQLYQDITTWTPLTNGQGVAKIQELQELKSAGTEITLAQEYIDNAIKV